MRGLFALAALSASTLAIGAANAEVAVGAGIGTAGFEGNVAVKLNDVVSLRGSYNHLQFDADDVEGEDVTYSGELDASTFGAFLDLHPFKNAFTITGGVYVGDRELSLDATPTTDVDIGGTTYTPAQVGTLSGAVGLGDTATYGGVGYDSSFTAEGRLGVRFALGVAMGDPSVDLSSTGSVSQADLDDEAALVEEDADSLSYYPIISLGLTYRF